MKIDYGYEFDAIYDAHRRGEIDKAKFAAEVRALARRVRGLPAEDGANERPVLE